MQLPIESIRIRKRVRKDLGDLGPLMDSLRNFGQLNPIVIDKNYELIAGHRRLESAKRIGWSTVFVAIVETQDDITKLEIELEENLQRRDLTETELADGLNQLKKLKNPNIFMKILLFFKRLWLWFISLFRK
ncbi:MAG: ParB N-terminal domain-containing protein [Spirochaetales bacterium]|nr:ParB N-terminal domain-containing protein [Spirochaetales bacterium]